MPQMASVPTIPPVDVSGQNQAHLARAQGIARGLNLTPGTEDDGWRVQPPVSLSDGSQIRLFKDGEALRCWYDAVCSARHAIFAESYIIADDDTGRAFRDQLIAKARSGVHVFLIYDSFGSHNTPHEYFDRMAREGVRVREFHPMALWRCRFSWRPFNRDHRKLLIVDNHFVGLGGLNIANEYGGSWLGKAPVQPETLWRDCGIALEGPAAGPFVESFRRTWTYVTRGGRSARAFLAHNLDGARGPVGMLSSVPSMAAPISRLLSDLLRQTRKSIDLTSAYFAPGDELVNLLCRAARRGARVRLMLPSLTDSRIMVTASRSFYEQLMASGVEVYERQQARLHAKTLVIDGVISLVGSTNFDYRSIDYNCELAAIIRSEPFALQMMELFEHDVTFSRRIDPRDWRRRRWLDRVVQWAVNRSRTLL